jgi:RNA polymerase sigma factor, sigma-70 family
MLFLYLSVLDTKEEKTKFEQLYEKYRKLMKYIADGILHDDFLAEDAVHDAFLKLTRFLDDIDDISSAKTKSFIVIITENICKDLYAKRKHEQTICLEDSEELLVQDDICLQHFDFSVIAEKIRLLPENYRNILILRYIYGYNSKEIADILDLNDVIVRKRLERTRRELTVLLRAEQKEE